jgi:hypothetical protein
MSYKCYTRVCGTPTRYSLVISCFCVMSQHTLSRKSTIDSVQDVKVMKISIIID